VSAREYKTLNNSRVQFKWVSASKTYSVVTVNFRAVSWFGPLTKLLSIKLWLWGLPTHAWPISPLPFLHFFLHKPNDILVSQRVGIFWPRKVEMTPALNFLNDRIFGQIFQHPVKIHILDQIIIWAVDQKHVQIVQFSQILDLIGPILEVHKIVRGYEPLPMAEILEARVGRDVGQRHGHSVWANLRVDPLSIYDIVNDFQSRLRDECDNFAKKRVFFLSVEPKKFVFSEVWLKMVDF